VWVLGHLVGLAALNRGLRQVEGSARDRGVEVIFFGRVTLSLSICVCVCDAVGVCGGGRLRICVLLVHVLDGRRSHRCGGDGEVLARDTGAHGGFLDKLHV